MACGACQYLRKKCDESCIFAPYFSCDEMGIAQFHSIHMVFGTGHFSYMLSQVPEDKRRDTAATIYYEAETRLRNPILGCYANIFALQNEVYELPFFRLDAKKIGCFF
jgi:hypothetical protein